MVPVKPSASQPVSVQEAIPAASVNNKPQTDSVELQSAPKKKRGPIRVLKDTIAGIKKAFASFKEYAKGTVKGITTGFAAGSMVFTAGSIFNALKAKSAQKAGLEVVKKFPNKLVAGVVAAGALAVNLWTASLNATEAKSDIDHRWKGHNNV